MWRNTFSWQEEKFQSQLYRKFKKCGSCACNCMQHPQIFTVEFLQVQVKLKVTNFHFFFFRTPILQKLFDISFSCAISLRSFPFVFLPFGSYSDKCPPGKNVAFFYNCHLKLVLFTPIQSELAQEKGQQ